MLAPSTITLASPPIAAEIAPLVGELLAEIMQAIGERAFNFDLAQTTARLEDFLARGQYVVFVAQVGAQLVGFISLTESHALYAEGPFGTIPELYVRPGYRSAGVGRQLLDQAKAFGRSRGWTRLEVTTPPLPQFDETLAFYEREAFAVTGGRKLKTVL